MQLRREEGQDPWVQAAKSVLARTAVRESLFKHYTALVDLATNYNTHDRSGSWRKDQGYIGAEVIYNAFFDHMMITAYMALRVHDGQQF